MGTQGLLVICNRKGVAIKLVVGCNGGEMKEFADFLIENKIQSPMEVYEHAKAGKIGCDSCRVVLYESKAGIEVEHDLDEDVGKLYFKTFKDPWFNPRWHSGTVHHGYRLWVGRNDDGEIVMEHMR